MKYNWSEEDCEEVLKFIIRASGVFDCAANRLMKKLDPRPNFRKVDVCVNCWKWTELGCPTVSYGTCDNFEREKVEPEETVRKICANCVYLGIPCHGTPLPMDACTEFKCGK